MNDKYFKALLFSYLCVAPINWLPYIPTNFVNGLKYLLFSILLVITVIQQSNKRKSVQVFTFHFFILILICEFPAIMKSKSDIFTNLIDISFIFLMNYLITQSRLTKDELFKVFFKASIFIGFICLLSLLSAISGITIISPAPWDDPFSASAFGGYRTGWSNSVFLFIPFLFYCYFFSRKKKWEIPAMLGILSIICSQILSGGRAGIIASLVTFLIFTRFKIQNVLLLGVTIFLLYNYFGTVRIEEYFRASEAQLENKEGISKLDKISSRRVEAYEVGWQLFKNSPLFGNGFSSATELTNGQDIHNTWFKRLVDGGIILMIPLIVLFISLYKKIVERLNRYANGEHHKVLFRALFFGALFISMLEPNYLIGSFQGEAFFWAVLSTYLK